MSGTGLDLNRLNQYRNEILKAEIASCLALWDKINPDEEPNKASISVSCKDLDCWSSDISVIDLEFCDKNNSIKKFNLWNNFLNNWRKWRKNKNKVNYLLQIFFGISENLNSGIDKGAPPESIKVKPTSQIWLANAFGSFRQKIIYFEKTEQEINNNIDEIKRITLSALKSSTIFYNNLKEIREKIKELFGGLLSDDRFPINDVSLWDQAYMVSSMFKALLSNYVLKGDFTQVPNTQEIKWRILGIQYDKLGLAEKGFKLASIKWYREISEEIDNKIKNLLEVDYPIGNEIYRDETGIYFIVGENIGKDNGEFAELDEDLKEIENKIFKIFRRVLCGEAYPNIVLTKASRGLMTLGYLLDNAKENFSKNKTIRVKNLNLIDPKKGKAIGICPLCKVRYIHEKDKERNNSPTICETCDKRIHHKQVEKWILDLWSETIWTTEIKDKNDRIALISLKFELQDWLNGNILNTLVLQRDIDFNEDLLKIKQIFIDIKNNKDKKVEDTILKKYTEKALYNRQIKNDKIIESFLLERSIGHEWEDFIKETLSNKSSVDFGNRKIEWNQLTDEDIEFLSHVLLQFLIRKNPSPARLRRIWESTEEFFKKVKEEVLDKNALEIPNWRRKRIIFEVDYSESIKMTGEELEGNGLLFWAQPEKDKSKIKIYLISSIEDFIEKYGTQEIKEKIKNNERLDINQDSFEDFKIELKRYSEREDKGVENVILTLEKGHLKEIHEYMPYASITDPTPVSWQIIIPAEYVPKFIDFVMEKYDKEFKYVYGKLPIHIGIIIQDYKKPLYIGLQALRKIKRNVRDINKLYIKDKSKDFCSKQIKKLSLEYYEEKCNSTEEYYSLYWDNSDNKDYLFYIKPDNNWKKWISTSYRFCSNDKITIIPNTFDFEFIDTNTRRNDIYYDENNYKRALYLKSNRPYEIETYWEKFKVFKELFKEKVSSSKLQKLVYVFYDKLENYEQNYDYLLASSVVNILELQKNQEAQKLIAKIFDLEDGKDILQELSEKLNEEKIKLFLDMFEFWHTALKEV